MTPLIRVVSIFPLVGALLSMSACTDTADQSTEKPKAKAPWVMELQVIPATLTIKPDKFYAKPFTVRAKYSNAIVKNVTKTVQWVSENTDLLSVTQKGELVVTGVCDQAKCPVFLVGTDPESGKSVRVTVNVRQPAENKQSKKKAADRYLG